MKLENLFETIYGTMATVYHRAKSSDRNSFSVSVGPQRTATSIFGGGFYTTYELKSQLTNRMIRNYGEWIYKLIIKVDNFFVLDKKERDKTKKYLSTKQHEVIAQIEEIIGNDEDFNHWVDDGYLVYAVNKYKDVDKLIRDNFEGLIYNSKDDGHCALIFDPRKSYVKVVSFAKVEDPNVSISNIKWTKIMKESITEAANEFDDFDYDLDGHISPEEVIRGYKDGLKRTPHDHWLDIGSLKLKKVPIACPRTIRKGFDASHNQLSTFENMPQHVYGQWGVRLHHNHFTSLKNIDHYLKSITGKDGLDISHNPIKSHLLALLKINGLKRVVLTDANGSKALHTAQRIINSYLPNNGGSQNIIKCQSDLLDAGLDEFAEL